MEVLASTPHAWHSCVGRYALFRNACRSGPLDTRASQINASVSLHMHALTHASLSLLLPLALPLLLLLSAHLPFLAETQAQAQHGPARLTLNPRLPPMSRPDTTRLCTLPYKILGGGTSVLISLRSRGPQTQNEPASWALAPSPARPGGPQPGGQETVSRPVRRGRPSLLSDKGHQGLNQGTA